MKKLLSIVLMCVLITTSAYAEITNLQTSGVTKVSNNQTNQCSGEYSFSIDTDRELLFINCQNKGSQNCFTQTGTYKIKHAETVKDQSVGTAYVFLISKDNQDYVLTITRKMVSFSKSGQTASLCWHFHITK